MTKNQIEKIANILKEADAKDETVIRMGLYFETVNSRFSSWKFWCACGKYTSITKFSHLEKKIKEVA